MKRDKNYRIGVRKKKIKQRSRKIKNSRIGIENGHIITPDNKHEEKIKSAINCIKPGLLAKGDYGAITKGVSVKTKTKKGHSSYRHKGGYGKSLNYSKHDKNQINNMDQELEDFYYDNL